MAAALAAWRGEWVRARALVVGILLASIIALPITLREIASTGKTIAYAFLADWILQLVALGPLLLRHGSAARRATSR